MRKNTVKQEQDWGNYSKSKTLISLQLRLKTTIKMINQSQIEMQKS